ncbi:MAG: hypothetical protein ACOY0T_14895 [Myxococcota bacterium]
MPAALAAVLLLSHCGGKLGDGHASGGEASALGGRAAGSGGSSARGGASGGLTAMGGASGGLTAMGGASGGTVAQGGSSGSGGKSLIPDSVCSNFLANQPACDSCWEERNLACSEVVRWLQQYCETSWSCAQKHCSCGGLPCNDYCGCIESCIPLGKEFCADGWKNYMDCYRQPCGGTCR